MSIKGCVVGVFAVVMLAMIPSRGETQEQEVAADGQREYQQSCAVCHGPEGKGGNEMKDRNFPGLLPRT